MRQHLHLLYLTLGLVVSPGQLQAQPKIVNSAREGIEFFETKIRPVLVNKCYECHSTKSAKVRGGLYLDSRTGVMNGGDSGAILVPGDPNKSLVLKHLRHQGDLKMPPKERLPDSVVRDFETWIRMGAPDPRTVEASAWKKLSLAEARTFWSLKPLQKPALPMVRDTSWPRADLDRFILNRLDQKNLKPVADADRVTLIRRLSYDLLGLPPTPEEIDDFINDKASTAIEKVVDRLLASKQYGERWGRYWLDIARYAESNGNADNTPFPHAWRYRDYVIKAFNEDRPYNRFVTEQIAGDLLPARTEGERDELLVATGFLALTSKPRAQNNPDYRMDLISDQIDVTTKAVLGLTVLCARCHDHKFDPISTREYYQLAGIFDSTLMYSGGPGKGGKKNAGPAGYISLSNGGLAMGVKEGRPADTAICIRGDATKRGETPQRGFLTVAMTEKTPKVNRTQSGRLELAQWLTQPDNPLTARVIVNRIWLHLFGNGLSRAVDNFGLLGEPASHPELLDHLAHRFIEDGWSIKKMIKHIVLSRTYQLSGQFSETNYKADPDNILWWRSQPRRLDAEAIRDGMLLVSGNLILTPPSGSLAGQVQVKKKVAARGKETNNRSVYLPIIRNGLPESLAIFDVADPSLVIGQREVTTVPAQALFLMNSPFVTEQARGLTKRILDAKVVDDSARVDLAFRIALGRTATTRERERVLSFVQNGGARQLAWTAFCQTLLASAEFRYLQ